ncbi:MAG: group II intron maturase-specific domain-containing protein [Prochloraceae cyanobacterium]
MSNSRKSGYKLLIKPSNKAIKDIKLKLQEVWLKHKAQEVKTLISKLNPIIRGWANYYRVGVSRKVFESLDQWMHKRARRYAKRMQSNQRKLGENKDI